MLLDISFKIEDMEGRWWWGCPAKLKNLKKMCQRAKATGHIGHMKQRNTPNILMVLNISQKKNMKQKALCWYFDKLHLDNSAEGELCSAALSLWRTFFRNFSRLECTPSLWYLLVGIKQNFASFVNVHSQTRVFEMHKTVKPDETFLRHEMIKKRSEHS